MTDNPRKISERPVIGEDLYGLSVEELGQRILDHQGEITRLKAELTKKSAERSAAEALFGKNPK